MIYGKPYQDPPSPFKVGDLVKLSEFYEGELDKTKTYKVTHPGHCHTCIEGYRFAIANWLLRKKGEKIKSYLRRNFG